MDIYGGGDNAPTPSQFRNLSPFLIPIIVMGLYSPFPVGIQIPVDICRFIQKKFKKKRKIIY